MPIASPIVSNGHFERKSAQKWIYEKLAVAATVILSILTFAALAYLLIWYLRRLWARSHHWQSRENDLFGQSAVSLAEDTSKALDEFLMTDVYPQRTSIIGGTRRSPSITMVFEDAYQDSPPHPYPTNHHAILTTMAEVNTQTNISTDESGPREPRSSMAQEAGSGKRSSSSTPRASMSLMDPTARSPQMWTTTSGSTDTRSLLSQASMRSRHPQVPLSPTSPLTLRSSRACTRHSEEIRGFDRPSGTGLFQPEHRRPKEKTETLRRGRARTLGFGTPPSSITPLLVDVSSDLMESRRASSRPPVPPSFRYSSPA